MHKTKSGALFIGIDLNNSSSLHTARAIHYFNGLFMLDAFTELLHCSDLSRAALAIAVNCDAAQITIAL